MELRQKRTFHPNLLLTINEKQSESNYTSNYENILLSTIAPPKTLSCFICHQFYNNEENKPMTICPNQHIACLKCTNLLINPSKTSTTSSESADSNIKVAKTRVVSPQQQPFKRTTSPMVNSKLNSNGRMKSPNNKITGSNPLECPLCHQKLNEKIHPSKLVQEIVAYVTRIQQVSRKQETKTELKFMQMEQINKQLRKENAELKKWIKEVSSRLKELEETHKWGSSSLKGGASLTLEQNSISKAALEKPYRFELPNPTEMSKSDCNFQISEDGHITKSGMGSFTNLISLNPIPKSGVHSFKIRLISSLSGGSILYGVCCSDVKNERFAWTCENFIGYSGNDGDVISTGSWSNISSLHPQGKKVRSDNAITTVIDMDNKMIYWRIDNKPVSDTHLIPEKMRNRLIYPVVVVQDGDFVQIVN